MKHPRELGDEELKRIAGAVRLTLTGMFGEQRVVKFLDPPDIAYEFCRQVWIEARKELER